MTPHAAAVQREMRCAAIKIFWPQLIPIPPQARRVRAILASRREALFWLPLSRRKTRPMPTGLI